MDYDRDKAAGFYYNKISDSKKLVKSYIDKFGNFTNRPSSFYIGSFDYETSCDDFCCEVRRRIKEHREEYSAGTAIQSGIGKYVDVIRRTVKDWEE